MGFNSSSIRHFLIGLVKTVTRWRPLPEKAASTPLADEDFKMSCGSLSRARNAMAQGLTAIAILLTAPTPDAR